MKVVDLHPEELLDKEARGELTELETERLETHLARCATCRFEREVRADFAAELDEDDGFPSQRMTALVEGLPKKQPDVVPEPEPALVEEEAPPATRRRAGRRNVRVVLLVAAALFAGSLATAGVGSRVWDRLTGGSGDDLTVTPPSPPSISTQASALAVAPSASASEHIFIEHEEASAAVQTASAAPTELATPPSESAATLFEAASEARRRGDYAQALTLHRRLQTQFAASREAHASQATVGRLLLNRGDATGALASFDAYQKHGSGSFDEPVMVGRATALERLGRNDDAREAWRALVTSFPDTPWRSHAEARLATMATSTP